MPKNLLIIESPNKIKTIAKYLSDKDFEIKATVGHVRDLPSSNAKAFDKKTYFPNWIVTKKPSDKQIIIDEIKAAAKNADKIYLATDPDREGEAIAWHVYDVLSDADKAKCVRITFNEITKEAITEAFNQQRKIDLDWVYSQFARRIIDRVIGYNLSQFVKRKYHGISAGRVQSVVLKFIYEREKQIEKFVPKSWWTLDIKLNNNEPIILREINPELKGLNFININDETSGTGIDFNDEKSATLVKNSLTKDFHVYLIDPPKIFKKSPKDPYKTSTMQQDAINKLHWDLNKVTNMAQDLYEGIEIDGVSTALISYPRTDSIRMAQSFILKTQSFIERVYGKNYFEYHDYSYKNKGNIQDAHECIRIIDPTIVPNQIRSKISPDHLKLYNLIWKRTIASLMSQSILESTIVRLINADHKFYTYSNKLVFDGFQKVYQDDSQNLHQYNITKYKTDEVFTANEIKVDKHTSTPPPRYNQASLIKTLDESGVGRPSTYRMMANIGLSRGYCVLKQKVFYMLPTGINVIEGLQSNFNEVIDQDFTKDMEIRLDNIADHKETWNDWIIKFIPKFDADISSKLLTVEKTPDKQTGRNCPTCGKPLVYRYSLKSKKEFIGCSNYPKCKYAEFPQQKILDELCPECNSHLIVRLNKKKQKFIGCSNYPKCKYIKKSS